MGNVSLSVNGRSFAVACDDGQERRVMELGHYIDKRLRDVARAAGAVSEQHLMVLTALFMADELFDAKAKVEELQKAPLAVTNATPAPANDAAMAEREAHMADIISALARKIEAVSGQLDKAQSAS